MLEQQCDEQPTDTTIPVEVGMDGLELNMCQPNANERRQAILCVKVLLEGCQERCQLLRWCWNESGVAGTRSTNPVLTTANFARLLVGTTDSAHQTAVRLVEQTYGKRQPASALDLVSRVLDCVQVVANFVHVIAGHSGSLFGFVLKKIYKGGLSTLNLRGNDCLFADKGIDEPVDRRHHFPGYFKTRKRLLGAPERRGKFTIHIQYRVTRRERVGNKRGDFRACDGPF